MLIFGLAMFGISSAAEAQPTVSLTSVDSAATEAGQETAGFSVTRTDDANTATTLRVFLEVTGSAGHNADYTTTNLNGYSGTTYYVDIPPNDLSRSVLITPVLDNQIENDENIVVTLLAPLDANHQYTLGSPSVAEATITDDVAEVHLVMTDPDAAEAGQDTANFTVTRDSHGNQATTLRVFLEVTGSAGHNVDYTTTNLNGYSGTTYYVDIPPNDLSRSVLITPVLEQLMEENESIIVTLLAPLDANHQYTVGSPSVVEAIILDFRDVIFRDSFEQ
jgi:hypothetical protein